MSGYFHKQFSLALPARTPFRELLRLSLAGAIFAVLLFVAGCTIGPKYAKPAAPAPAPDAYKEAGDFQPAQPSDAAPRGNWWEVFQDPKLNDLEKQIDISNQNLKIAEAQYQQARAAVRYFRGSYYPVVGVNPAASRVGQSQNKALYGPGSATDYSDLLLPVDISYEPDVWGQVRRTVESARAEAQATAADLATVNLSLHAELAMDYFELRGLDTEEQLLNSTVEAFENSVKLTQDRFKGGLASEVDVAQAQTQLETTRAQSIDIAVQRTAFEHAIGVLIGQPASGFALSFSPLLAPPPPVPPGLPSQLLERRPDIAAAERRVDAANAQIGVAKTAYYPSITLAASGGFESSTLTNLLSGPSGLWAFGASALETIFEGGRRHAITAQAQAAFDQSVASYRQTVLTAFQEVEDNLAAQRILQQETVTEDAAVAAAQRSLALSNNRYTGGVTSYLEVITAQSAALANERAAADILTRRAVASVLLIKALGGGWDVSSLPAD
ncbi:MAG TPA: efflux transporter outer membrane subunit [Candidatus Acidoferrales bacterium]|nr:efflux transporter outer membrane subunit [Candidatus Acidoferrales bacterium]